MQVHRSARSSRYLGDQEMTVKLVDEVAPRYLQRPGGYTRILKLGPRQGDNAPMARIELVSFVASLRCASAGSYSLRSAMRRVPEPCAGVSRTHGMRPRGACALSGRMTCSMLRPCGCGCSSPTTGRRSTGSP